MSYDFDPDLVNRQRAAKQMQKEESQRWQEQHDQELGRKLREMERERNKKKGEEEKVHREMPRQHPYR